MKLSEHMRVKLISTRHGISDNNPVWSKYKSKSCAKKIVGTVVTIEGKRGLNIRVKWDNGNYNVYSESDLEIIDLLENELFEI